MNAILKYPGGKWSYAQWICSFMPPHKFYLEPFFGSGAVFFTKEPAMYETINDLDDMVVNFFRICRDHPEELARLLELTPYSRSEYTSIQEDRAGESVHLTDNPVENARRFAVRCSQGYGSKMADRVGWKNTKHSTGPVNPRVWNWMPDTVLQVSRRLKDAQIEHTDAVKLIKDCGPTEDRKATDCLIYADPPYHTQVRDARMYRHEMLDPEEHIPLLEALMTHDGPVILSGYDNPLYNKYLQGWHKESRTGRNNSGKSCTETLWLNFCYQTRL